MSNDFSTIINLMKSFIEFQNIYPAFVEALNSTATPVQKDDVRITVNSTTGEIIDVVPKYTAINTEWPKWF